jgi:hypothetical protein
MRVSLLTEQLDDRIPQAGLVETRAIVLEFKGKINDASFIG